MEPTHSQISAQVQKLDHALTVHEVRLARLEERQTATSISIDRLVTRMDKVEAGINELITKANIAADRGKLILKLITILLPFIASLQIWDKFI